MSLDLSRLWTWSGYCNPGYRPNDLRGRMRFMLAAARHKTALQPFAHPSEGSALCRAMRARPEIVGAVLWPYQVAEWPAETRLRRICEHYAATDTLGASYRFDLDEKVILSDLSVQYPGLQLVLDQPKWFMREGGVVLNLFIEEFRAYSLAFSFRRNADHSLEVFVGGLQGRNTESARDLYRELTKAFHGIRPRDLLFEVLRLMCQSEGVERLFAVSQSQRHHRHPYFGKTDLSPDYDAIWADRGGKRESDAVWQFSVSPPRRDIETIKPKKRSLYRKRFALLDQVAAKVEEGLSNPTVTKFSDT